MVISPRRVRIVTHQQIYMLNELFSQNPFKVVDFSYIKRAIIVQYSSIK